MGGKMLKFKTTQFMTADHIENEYWDRIRTIKNELKSSRISKERHNLLSELLKKLSARECKTTFADIRYSSDEQVKIFNQFSQLLTFYEMSSQNKGVFVTVNCCDGRMPDKKPILLDEKELLSFNPKQQFNSLRKQLEAIKGAFGYISFEVKFHIGVHKFIPHFHIIVLGSDRATVEKHFNNYYPEFYEYRLNPKNFKIGKNVSPMVYYYNQRLKILDFEDIKNTTDNIASYICKFKTYKTRYHFKKFRLVPYAKSSKNRCCRPPDKIHNSHLLFLDSLNKGQFFSLFGKNAMTGFVTKYKAEFMGSKLQNDEKSPTEVKKSKNRLEHNYYRKPLITDKNVLNLFGYDSFKSKHQKAVVDYMNKHKSSLVIFATGSGKSFIFQASALKLPGLCVVIEPTKNLMADQVRHLNCICKNMAATFNSDLTTKQKRKVLSRLEKKKYKFLYVSPKTVLDNPELRNILQKLTVSMVVIDEAHCIYHWGEDFMTDYKRLDELSILFPKAKFMALTATADRLTQKKIKPIIGYDCKIFQGDLKRSNIQYEVIKKESDGTAQLLKILAPYLDGKKARKRVIIYCNHIAMVSAVHNFLQDEGIESEVCTGETKDSRTVLKTFHKQPCIVVATSAFGMGIDRKDVRCVIHYEMPCNLEFYYQESGRAGRDGKNAKAVMMVDDLDRDIAFREFCRTDTAKIKKFRLVEQYIKLPKSKRRDFLIKHIS